MYDKSKVSHEALRISFGSKPESKCLDSGIWQRGISATSPPNADPSLRASVVHALAQSEQVGQRKIEQCEDIETTEKAPEEIGAELAGFVAQRFQRQREPDPVVQLQCSYARRPYEANYQDSGHTIDTVFSNDYVEATAGRWVQNTLERGTFAHEVIQQRHANWTAEFGFPNGNEGGWGYADMVRGDEIYEIKPFGGTEPALDQARRYRDWGNKWKPGSTFVLGSTNIRGRRTWERTVNEVDYEIALSYWKARDGEILYQWSIKNLTQERARKEAESKKRKKRYREGKERKSEETNKRERKSTGGGISRFFAAKT